MNRAENPYDIIENIIRSDPNFCYQSYLVGVTIDGDYEGVLLLTDGDGDDGEFVWEYDWWEGQKKVILTGYQPVNQCIVVNPTRVKIYFNEKYEATKEKEELKLNWIDDFNQCKGMKDER